MRSQEIPDPVFVQDNTINQKVLKRQLVSQKYEVTLAGNGLEALEILQAVSDRPEDNKGIDLILLDIEMVRLIYPV